MGPEGNPKLKILKPETLGLVESNAWSGRGIKKPIEHFEFKPAHLNPKDLNPNP